MARSGYRRVLLKLSGEAFADPAVKFGIDPGIVSSLALQLAAVQSSGAQIAVVVGGGNIFRGSTAAAMGMERARADYMGMLATVINGLALADSLGKLGSECRVMSAIWMQEVAEPFIRGKALRHLERGRIVIFAGGTGNPYFTTDTAASVRALEVDADALIKGTKVDGVYDSDPTSNPDAVRIEHVEYIDVLNQGLKVMDATAISLCMDNEMPIVVFDVTQEGNIQRVVNGEAVGTTVSNTGR